MPPKSITCSICHTTVFKAQTLALKDGTRACREHPQVTDEAQAIQAAERARIEREIAHPKRKPWMTTSAEEEARRATYAADMEKWREHVYSHCWVCDIEGVDLQTFFFNNLIALKRLELREEFNFFNLPADLANLTGHQVPLGMVPYLNEAVDKAIVKHIKDKRLRDILHFIQQVFLCPKCAKLHGYMKRWEALLPKPTFDQIEAMMPITASIDPLLVELAKKKEQQN